MTESQLRAERDRFVALAFSAADVLIELDADLRIVFAAGAMSLLGTSRPEQLVGQPIEELIDPRDRSYCVRLLRQADGGERIAAKIVGLAMPDGSVVPAAISGHRLSELGDRYFVSLSSVRNNSVFRMLSADRRDAESGLAGAEDFTTLAAECLNARNDAHRSSHLTLVEVDHFGDLQNQLEAHVLRDVAGHIGDQLRAMSIDGMTAGRLADNKYGVVHDGQFDTDRALAQLQSGLSSLAPAGEPIEFSSATIDIGAGALDPDDAIRALIHTVERFTREPLSRLSIANLDDGYQLMLNDVVNRISEFRTIMERESFGVAYQPIVNLADGTIHHFEALARFDGEGSTKSPFEMITFAEEVGVIGEFDVAMTRRVLSDIETVLDAGLKVNVAVNISGRSLTSRFFLDALDVVLDGRDQLRQHLSFEVTETSEISDLPAADTVVQKLRKRGHHVSLDDFGSGAAAFHYLRELSVDIVKIDGDYIVDALASAETRAFLKAIIGLCHDLGIATVAERVEDETTARFLRDSGVSFAQGFLFGKPTAGLAQMVLQVAEANLQPSAQTSALTAEPVTAVTEDAAKPSAAVAASVARRKGYTTSWS